jgi:uncharacterized OsmC-like protein
MAEELEATMTLTDGRIRYAGSLRGLPEIVTDYPPPAGEGKGYTSLEVFLFSLASCTGGTMGFVLRKVLRKDAREIKVTAAGTRRTEHPLSFSAIHLDVAVHSADASVADLEQAYALAEETYCPVMALIKGNVVISRDLHVSAP